eukprot:2804041-Prymnesium_polylepis.1
MDGGEGEAMATDATAQQDAVRTARGLHGSPRAAGVAWVWPHRSTVSRRPLSAPPPPWDPGRAARCCGCGLCCAEWSLRICTTPLISRAASR